MRNFLSFEEAILIIQSFNFMSVREYREWIKLNKGSNIPFNPDTYYKNNGWVNYKHFFGKKYKKDFIDYESAKKIIIDNNIKCKKEFDVFIKNNKNYKIPTAPNITYLNNGWISWGSFCSTKNVYRRKFLEYKNACNFIRKYNFKTQKQYLLFIKNFDNLPTNPNIIYHEEWINWKTYLSIDKLTNLEKSKNYLSHEECRIYISNLKLKSVNHFREWVSRPHFIPSSPSKVYKDKGWISWGYFLSNNNLSFNKMYNKFLNYEDAVIFLSKLSIKHKFDYHDYIISNNIDFLPKRPESFYREKWSGYLHYLSAISNRTSFGERKIKEFLDNHNIIYEREKRFNDCKNKKSLPFDFYLSMYNICIEYDGQHHFNIVSKFGGEAFLKKVQLNDLIKSNWCILNNIKLIRISFKNKGKIDKILSTLIV